jgi:hypothetical protein
MEEEMICENFEHRIQMIGKIRLLSSHYLVFKSIYKRGKYKIVP